MADDINGDKMTDYYTHAGYAEVISEMKEEILPAKKKKSISPYKLLAGVVVIVLVLLIITYFIR